MARAKLKKIQQNIIMILLLLIGIGVLVYPDVANWVNSNNEHRLIQEFNYRVALMAEAEREYELERARVFNDGLSGIHVVDPFVPGSGSIRSAEYYSILNFDGIMGRIIIPAIEVNMTIRHGTSDRVLAIGAGHMENTSFPVGGYGTHAIITAHTGMLNNRLFNDLILLDIGDEFFVEVMGQTIAYQVDRINRVYPHEIEILVSYEDRDLITLVTCTPYGINTHRLLVRGTRIEYITGMEYEIEVIVTPLNIRLIIVIGFSVLFAGIIWFYWQKKREIEEDKRLDGELEAEYAEWLKSHLELRTQSSELS